MSCLDDVINYVTNGLSTKAKGKHLMLIALRIKFVFISLIHCKSIVFVFVRHYSDWCMVTHMA